MGFRSVALPGGVEGRLYLHSMPGRYEPLDDTWRQVRELKVSAIVNLTEDEEARRRSPAYAQALAEGTVPCEVWPIPVQDFGAPEDDAPFLDAARRVAASLRSGHAVLVHCGAGIGRTGTFAVAVLMALGMTPANALWAVGTTGSGPEGPAQEGLLGRLETALKEPLP